MSILRFHAIKESLAYKPVNIDEKKRRSETFGENVFNENTMRQYLTRNAFKSVMNAIEHGKKIDRNIADQAAMMHFLKL